MSEELSETMSVEVNNLVFDQFSFFFLFPVQGAFPDGR
jgi:hypothetical protein